MGDIFSNAQWAIIRKMQNCICQLTNGGGGNNNPPNLAIAGTDASGNIIDGSANVIAQPLTGLTITNAAIVATDTLLAMAGKAQGQINTRIGLTSPLTGFTVGANSAIVAADTVLQAFGKTQGQINARAPLASPALTGTPTAPTAAAATNTTQVATTAFVRQEIAAIPAPATPDLAAVVAIGSNLPLNSSIYFKDSDGSTNIGILRSSGTNTFQITSGTGKTIAIMPTNGLLRLLDSNGSSGTSTLSLELKLGTLPAGNNVPLDATLSWNQNIANIQAQIDAINARLTAAGIP